MKPELSIPQLLPLDLATIARVLDQVGYVHYSVDEPRGRVVLDIQGDETLLRLNVLIGKTQSGETWYVRLLTFSIEFEPRKAGVDRPALLDWLNRKNEDLLFGRYYYNEESDTVAFEVSLPGNHGVIEEDLLDLLRIATVSVDKAHADLKRLVPDA